MRNSVDELNQIQPDFSVDSAKEITPPPDEFNAAAVQRRPEKKGSSIRKVMLYLASIGVVTLGIITPVGRILPPETADRTEAASAMPSIAAEATAAPAPETSAEVPTEAPTPVPTQEPTPVPPLSGKIHIVVYSEVFDSGSAPYPSEVLEDVTVDAESFTGFPLPPLPTQKGYTAVGYVLLRNSGIAYLETLYFDHADPDVIGSKALGDTLTASDLRIVPRNADGVYEAEIHVVWLQDGGKFHLEFYDDALIGEYDVGFPVNLEGLCYLAVFPEPVRTGKTFVGWSDVNGRLIDAVTYFDFFAPKQGAKTMEEREWSIPIPCRVYARWSDGTGGPPEPTPMPMCKVTCSGCSLQTNDTFSVDGTVPAGTVVTAFAWQELPAGWFVMKTASGQTFETDLLWGTRRETQMSTGWITYVYSFSVTFTITEDTTIKFVTDYTHGV